MSRHTAKVVSDTVLVQSRIHLVMLAATVFLFACGEPSAPDHGVDVAATPKSRADELAEFKKAIRAKYDMKEQAFRDNDPEPILTRFYADTAISTDNEGNTHAGRDELRNIYEEVIGALVRIESYKTFVKGDAGWDWVNFHVSFPPESNMDPFTFKMLFLWERIDGEWWSQGEMYVLGEFDIPR